MLQTAESDHDCRRKVLDSINNVGGLFTGRRPIVCLGGSWEDPQHVSLLTAYDQLGGAREEFCIYLSERWSAFFPESSWSIFCMSRSKSTGLVSKSSQPAARALSREPDMACAVSAIMGMALVAGLLLSRRVASQPSTTGRSRSITIKTGNSAVAIVHPVSPFSATSTSKPSSSSKRILSM